MRAANEQAGIDGAIRKPYTDTNAGFAAWFEDENGKTLGFEAIDGTYIPKMDDAPRAGMGTAGTKPAREDSEEKPAEEPAEAPGEAKPDEPVDPADVPGDATPAETNPAAPAETDPAPADPDVPASDPDPAETAPASEPEGEVPPDDETPAEANQRHQREVTRTRQEQIRESDARLNAINKRAYRNRIAERTRLGGPNPPSDPNKARKMAKDIIEKANRESRVNANSLRTIADQYARRVRGEADAIMTAATTQRDAIISAARKQADEMILEAATAEKQLEPAGA